jgi:hypothetical protein
VLLYCRRVATHFFRRPPSPPFSMMKCAPGRCLILPDHYGGTKYLSELQASVFVNGHATIMLHFKVRCCTPHVFCRNQMQMLLFVRSGLDTAQARSIGAFPCPIYYPACALCVSSGLHRCTLMYTYVLRHCTASVPCTAAAICTRDPLPSRIVHLN